MKDHFYCLWQSHQIQTLNVEQSLFFYIICYLMEGSSNDTCSNTSMNFDKACTFFRLRQCR